VKKSAEHPLVVEWPSADRATLEARAQSGLVAVRYVGCEMEVLHRCKLPGKYGYTAITPKHDTVTIRDTDELYASMPVGAAKLEGALAQTGQLNVSMTIVGRYDADHTDFTSDVLDSDDCARATHVVSGMTTGAFELSTGADASVGGGVSVAGIGGGAKSTSKRETLERDGHEEKCEGGSGAAGQPPDGCGAVLRLDVLPLVTPKREKRESVVGAAETATSPDTIAPNLYAEGNLRVAVYCAESTDIKTPETGLRVLIDGKADGEKSLKTNFMTTLGTQTVNKVQVPVTLMNFTDVGFLVQPGLHHLRVETDDCSPLDADVVVSGTHAVNVEANLEVSKDMLKGPVGAPWGGAWLIGASYGTMPSAVFNPSNGTHFNGYGTPSTVGGLLGFTYEHRYFTMMFNYFIGYGSYSAIATQETAPMTGSPTTSFTGSEFEMMAELRFGARLPLAHYIALMAGSGIGASMWIGSSTTLDAVTESNLNGLTGFWHVPLWGAVDIKPFCNWGVQVGGALNVQPTALDGSYTMFHAGIIWQPSPSCERVPGINVSP
jgi:hypothetical protein